MRHDARFASDGGGHSQDFIDVGCIYCDDHAHDGLDDHVLCSVLLTKVSVFLDYNCSNSLDNMGSPHSEPWRPTMETIAYPTHFPLVEPIFSSYTDKNV